MVDEERSANEGLASLRDMRGAAGPLFDALVRSGMAVAVADTGRAGSPFIFANPAFLNLTGFAAEEIAGGACLLDDWIGDGADGHGDDAGGGSHSLEVRTHRKDGSAFWNSITLTRVQRSSPLLLVTAADAMSAREAQEVEKTLETKRLELERLREQSILGWKITGASGAWDWDIPAGRLYADMRFSALSGIPPDEAMAGVPGSCFFSGIHPDDRLRVQIAVAAALQGAEVFVRTYRMLLPDGSVRWVSAHGRSFLGPDEKPVRFSGVLTDITEQKRVEEQLQLAQTAGGIGTFVYESGYGTAEVSSQFCRLLGFHRADALPVRTINSVVHADDPPIIGGAEPLESGEIPYTELRIRRADDGAERWIALRGQTRAEGGGRRLLGAIYDVTDAKRAQHDLQELNRTLERRVHERTRERDRVWSLSKDLICVCDFDGVLRAVNPAWHHVLGLSLDDLIGTTLHERVHPDDREELRHKFVAVREERALPDFDLRLSARDRKWSCINWSITAEGEHIYCVGRDVTTRLQLQAELHQSQKMEAVGQLTGGIAHDFNNMLTGVIGSLDMIRRRIDAGRVNDLERFMAAATNSAQRAAALTHRLLAFSRRQSLENKPVDLNSLARSMEDMLRRTLGEQIHLVVNLEHSLPRALIDPNQVESAILNLAINARDAMAGGGRLTIETRHVKIRVPEPAKPEEIPPGDYVCISVSDTGSGMSEDVLAKAFDPFFTTKPIGQGTGLGLSMIYGFVQQSRGHIVIDSALGQGTKVTLYLPECDDAELTKEEGGQSFAPSGNGEQILVVEDDPSVRLLVLDVLKELNYVAIESHGGRHALEIIESPAAISLLITDVGLPGLNGRQIAEIARRRRPDLPILFMTAYSADALNRNRFLEPGMTMVSKPFSMDELGRKIRAILG